MKIRQIQRKDFRKVHDLALQGWYAAYSHLSKEDLKRLVDRRYSLGNLGNSLRALGGKEEFLVAFEGKKLIGFCHVRAGKEGELLSLYSEPALIGKGLGKRLLHAGEKFLESKGCTGYVTFANRHNTVGVAFYLRNGFIRRKEKDKDDEFERGALLCLGKEFGAPERGKNGRGEPGLWN